jgi:hypothetical protein
MQTKRYGPPTALRRAALCAISALACVLAAPLAQAQATTQTFGVGQSTFTVPAGVTSINVLAIGEAGDFIVVAQAAVGGKPAEVRGELSVTPGQTLYVEVPDRAGFNGGGQGGNSFCCNGGGAADVRTSPQAAGLSPDTRLIVAGGGGGAGENNPGGPGAGGNAGEPGKNAVPEAGTHTVEGGGAGTLTHGGAGGLGDPGNGAAGTLGSGGSGGIGAVGTTGEPSGGGGGGGYYGGGGGGGGAIEPGNIVLGAGGGGGSSLVPAGGSMAVSSKVCGPEDPKAPQPPCGLVQISYTIPLTVTKVEPNHGSPGGGTAVTITGTGFTGGPPSSSARPTPKASR